MGQNNTYMSKAYQEAI